MTHRHFSLYSARPLVLTAALSILAACAPDIEEGADILIFGGPIYTGVEGAPNAEAVAVKDGRIIAVGARREVDNVAGLAAQTIDLKGAALYPGFVDAHAHLFGIGMRELTLNLEGVGSIDELVDIVAAEVTASAPEAVVYGRGWIETGWPEDRFPHRDDLDPVSPETPVLLTRSDGHAMLVNSAALTAAGIDENTPDPDGGRIEKDEDGRLTGLLIDRAMELTAGLIDEPTPTQRRQAYIAGAQLYAARGWTGLHNMSVEPGDVTVMETLAGASMTAMGVNQMPIRVYNALDPAGLDWLEENAPRTDETGRIVTRAVKLYADGALGSRGAALHEPYSDMPGTRGLLLMQEEEAKAMMARARDAGVQVATHAIGDRGNSLVLDWYADVLEGDEEDRRWRIEHAQIVDPDDIPRFAEGGVIASMQPSHAIGDLHFAPARLGDERLDGAYAWRSLIDAGAIVVGGSDAPVEQGDPLIEFYAAVARRDLDGYAGEDWRPGEAVSREEALKMFTLWPAVASFQEEDLGSIETGKRADFTAFSIDIMTVPSDEILSATPVFTMVDGVVVFSADTAAQGNAP